MRYTNEFIEIGNKQVKQINKTEAKKVYEQGQDVYLNACNMMLKNSWTRPNYINKKSCEKFEAMVNEYEYYNCCSERGKYANYFININ